MSLTKVTNSMIQGAPYNVLDYGADPTGVLDSTLAFNQALGYDIVIADNTSNYRRAVEVPPGNYKIEGSVYIQKGMTLYGQMGGASRIVVPIVSSTADTFVLGFGVYSGVVTETGGGLPPAIQDFATEGGHVGASVVKLDQIAGGSIRNMFVTTAPLGMILDCGDLILDGCTFDVCAVAVRLGGSRNTLTNCIFFNNSAYSIVISTPCYDWLIHDNVFSFSQINDILIESPAGTCKGLSIANNNFVDNGQYVTKSANIFISTGGNEVIVNDCNFSNAYGYQILNAGSSNVVIQDCRFTGLKTNSAYVQSSTTKGIYTGNGGTLEIKGCDFKHMFGAPIIIDNATTTYISDCSWSLNTYTGAFAEISSTSAAVRLVGNAGDNVMPMLPAFNSNIIFFKGNVNWLGAEATASGRKYYVIPTYAAFAGTVTVTACPNPGGSVLYHGGTVLAISRGTDFISSAITDYVSVTSLHNPSVGLNGSLDIQVCFTAPGNAVTATPSTLYRGVCISVPSTYADFYLTV